MNTRTRNPELEQDMRNVVTEVEDLLTTVGNEGRLVFVPRREHDEHCHGFSGEGSLTRFFRSVEPLSNAMESPSSSVRIDRARAEALPPTP